ncbi:MAG TPA: RidA family protein [Dehalococcoidia bacterium]
MSAEARLAELGLMLPEPPRPAGLYAPTAAWGGFLFTAGQVPFRDGQVAYRGKLGRDLTVEEGRAAARLAALNGVAAARRHLGSLDLVTRVVRLTVYVASAEGFTAQPAVADGASELLRELWGEAGVAARSAVGVAELPLGAAVEVELTFAMA